MTYWLFIGGSWWSRLWTRWMELLKIWNIVHCNLEKTLDVRCFVPCVWSRKLVPPPRPLKGKTSLFDWSRKFSLKPFNQSESRETSTIRASGCLPVFTLSTHWFPIKMSSLPNVTCDNLGFGFTSLSWKALSSLNRGNFLINGQQMKTTILRFWFRRLGSPLGQPVWYGIVSECFDVFTAPVVSCRSMAHVP